MGEICAALAQAEDPTLSCTGQALQQILSGTPPEQALADLPADLREPILSGLREDEKD